MGMLYAERRGGDAPLTIVPFLLGQESDGKHWRVAADVSAVSTHLKGKQHDTNMWAAHSLSTDRLSLYFRKDFSYKPLLHEESNIEAMETNTGQLLCTKLLRQLLSGLGNHSLVALLQGWNSGS